MKGRFKKSHQRSFVTGRARRGVSRTSCKVALHDKAPGSQSYKDARQRAMQRKLNTDVRHNRPVLNITSSPGDTLPLRTPPNFPDASREAIFFFFFTPTEQNLYFPKREPTSDTDFPWSLHGERGTSVRKEVVSQSYYYRVLCLRRPPIKK